MTPSPPQSALDFRQMRVARVLLLLALLTPLLNVLGMVLLPLASLVGMWRAKRWRLLFEFGAALLSTGLVAGLALAIGHDDSALLEGISLVAMCCFVVVCLSSPTWLAITLWGEQRPRWHALGYAAGLVACSIALPLGLMVSVGVGFAPLGILASMVLLALAVWPLLKGLPPVPELIPLATALDLEPTKEGWRGADLFLSKRGHLTLDLPFGTPISGLFAAKRGQQSQGLRLLGDPVLDNLLELALPEPLQHMAQEPTLLLEAVHGAKARVDKDGISLNQHLDKVAFRSDPRGERDRVLNEIRAIRALHTALQSASSVLKGAAARGG
jgi:hypothetical protein